MSRAVNPPALGPAKGFAHGMRAGDLVFVAGQIGAEPIEGGRHRVVSPEFVAQFEKALENSVAVVTHAGGNASDIVEMTVYVADMQAYRDARARLGKAWKSVMGSHYPAMTLVEVSDFFEDGVLVEIRAVAHVIQGGN